MVNAELCGWKENSQQNETAMFNYFLKRKKPAS